MLNRINYLAILIMMLILFLFSSNVYGQEDIKAKMLKFISISTDIVYGKALFFESKYSKSGNSIFTDLTFEVNAVFKGAVKENDRITVRLPGGTVNGLTTFAVHAPSFKLEEEAVLFLKEIKDSRSEHLGKYFIVKMSESKYNVYGAGPAEKKYVVAD